MSRRLWRGVVLSFLLVVSINAVAAMVAEKVFITFPHSIPGHDQRGNVLLVVYYEKDDANRKLAISWDNSDTGFAGSSEVEITLENNGVPVSRDLDLPAGDYVFSATVIRNDGSVVQAMPQRRFITR